VIWAAFDDVMHVRLSESAEKKVRRKTGVVKSFSDYPVA
jgi:hypothetical protein